MNNQQLRLKDYNWNETVDHITAASAQTCAREAVKQTELLRLILGRLDQLGTDGVHDVIRTMRTEMRAQQRARRAAARVAP